MIINPEIKALIGDDVDFFLSREIKNRLPALNFLMSQLRKSY